MDPLSITGGVVGIVSLGIQVTQGLLKYYSAYKRQKSDIAHTTKKLERLLDILGFLDDKLAQQGSTFKEQALLEKAKESIQGCGECICDLQNEYDKFKDNSANDLHAAARTIARRLAYPFRQSTLQKLDEDVDEIVSHLSLAMQLLDASKVQDDLEDTKTLLNLARASQISWAIRDWLRAPDATINYNDACKKRHASTGLWFVKGASFSAWLTKPNSFLWLYGFAGCGKSVLCSTAIQYAFRHRRSNPRIGLAFFFFSFNDNAKQDTSAMLRALILQLSGQLDDNHAVLSRLHDTYRNAMPPDQALMDCLHKLVQAFDDTYIILDALDETPLNTHRRDVLQTLVDLQGWSESCLHILVTSREEPDIRDVIRDEICVSQDEAIPLKNDFVDNDIAAFISSSLKTDRRLRRWELHHDLIGKTLTERAKGVYVYFNTEKATKLKLT